MEVDFLYFAGNYNHILKKGEFEYILKIIAFKEIANNVAIKIHMNIFYILRSILYLVPITILCTFQQNLFLSNLEEK